MHRTSAGRQDRYRDRSELLQDLEKEEQNIFHLSALLQFRCHIPALVADLISQPHRSHSGQSHKTPGEAGKPKHSGYPGCRTLTASREENCPVIRTQSCKPQPQSILHWRTGRHWVHRTKTSWVLKLQPQTLHYAPPAFHKQDYAGLAYFEIWPLLIRLGCPRPWMPALTGLFHLQHPLL